jgi:hypothetical protein
MDYTIRPRKNIRVTRGKVERNLALELYDRGWRAFTGLWQEVAGIKQLGLRRVRIIRPKIELE